MAAAAVGRAAATSRAAQRAFADRRAIADAVARATGATGRAGRAGGAAAGRCGSAEAIPRAESPSVPRRAGGEGVRVSVVGRGPLPIGSLRARAAAARLGGSGRPAGGVPLM